MSGDAKNLNVFRISTQEEMNILRDSWNRLSKAVPFCTWDWLQCWWKYYGTGRPGRRQLFTLLVCDISQQIIGIAPWYLENSLYQGKTIRFLGDGEVCSDYVSILARPEDEETVAITLSRWMTQQGKEFWDHCNFESIGVQDRVVWKFIEQLRFSGCILDSMRIYHRWRLPLPESWAAYLAGRSSSHRCELRSLERKYLLSGKVTLRHAKKEEELKRCFEILVALHQKRKKALSKNTTFASARFIEFQREASSRLMAEGKLNLVWLEYENQPIAILYDFVGERVIYGYASGFDPECTIRAAGKLLFIAVFKQAIEQGFVAYDFLRGDEPYKMHWKAVPEECYQVCITNNKPSAFLRSLGGRVLRSVKRRILNRPCHYLEARNR
ncbi:MAG: GNAT family N-acetyltransferase [Candidatus Brocadia sp.]|jgi:hypothetical protein